MRWRNSLLVLLVLHFATIGGQENNEVDDNHTVDLIGDIIIHGEERRLSGTDRIAILRTQARHIRYTLISSEEECALKKFVKSTPVTRCELLQRKICKDEFVLLRKPVKENCTERSEFCEAFHRMQVFHSETVFCEQKYEIDCSEDASSNITLSEAYNNNVVENTTTETVTAKPLPIVTSTDNVSDGESGETCYPKRMAVCRTVPQRVTLTERKQKCNGEDDYRTTKMCTTREDGSGGCVNFIGPGDVCDEHDEMKVVNSELGSPTLSCSSSKISDGRNNNQFCFPSRCRVVSNSTSCVRDRLPTKFEMKEVVCERCVEGRVKVRPVVETRNICRKKEENFCLDTVDREVRWRKWCRKLKYGEASSIRPRAAAADDEEGSKSESKYHIELSPGKWVTTTNRTEARKLLIRQKEAEEKYPVAYVEKDQANNNVEKTQSSSARDSFLEETSSEENKVIESVASSTENTIEVKTSGNLTEKLLNSDAKKAELPEQPRSAAATTAVANDEDQPPVNESNKVIDEKSSFRARISSCLFNPRKCRFR